MRLLSIGLSLSFIVALFAPGGASAQRNDARAHFDRGIELFNEGRFEQALVEFEQAYNLAPAAAALYNLGRVHEALGDAVDAVDAYERYLRDAGNIPSERRQAVEAALRRQRARIATLMVRTNVDGAQIQIDGVDIASTPLAEPLRVTSGRLAVGIHAPGYERRTLEVEVAGGRDRTITVELEPISGALGTVRVVTDLPGVRIVVDGDLVGTTPLNRTIPLATGEHSIIAERQGYERERRDVRVEGGAEVHVEFDLVQDAAVSRADLGRVRLHLPSVAYAVRVDGEAMITDSGSVELVAGEHELVIEAEGREPYRTTVDVPAGGRLDLTPPLEWNPMERSRHIESASSIRTLGWGLSIPGVAVLGASLGLVLWNEGEVSDTDRSVILLNMEITACGPGNDVCVEALQPRADELMSQQDTQNIVRVLTIAGTIIGAAGVATGLTMLLLAPSEESIDESAHASVHPVIGPNSIGVFGQF